MALPRATVLITEDEPLVREFAYLVIQDAGHVSLGASSVEEALAIIRSSHPIDVLFTDINLRPLTDGGLELAREAIKYRPELRVIYTTGRQLTAEMRAMLVDNSRLLVKPYTPSGLVEALARTLEERYNHP